VLHGLHSLGSAKREEIMKARLVESGRVAEATAGFTFEVQDPFTFDAGQTCDLTIPSPRYEDEKGSSRTFSIASSPSDAPRITVATRLTGSAFKRSLLEAPVGLEIDLDGPFGSFVLHRNAAKPAVFLAGGIGITPFRSIIKDATERRLPHAMTLFVSNRTPASTAFLPDLEAWQRQNPNFRLVATITDASGGEAWSHSVGLMDASFMRPHVSEWAAAICYLAGPPAYVKAMRAALDGVGADPDNIRTEEFSGY
jgi:ferredoxin-NADP reductase